MGRSRARGVGVGLLLAVAALGADAEPPVPSAASPFALPTADALARAAQATLLATPSPPSTGDDGPKVVSLDQFRKK